MRTKKKVILSAGGTGGHLFPAQVVADSLQRSCDILFVAGGLKKSPYFNREKYPFKEIKTATITFRSPLKAIKAIFLIFYGFAQSLKIFTRFKPDLVVGFGSFFTFPILLAAKLKGIPILLHEQNTLPGKVNRIFSTSALATAITFPETARFLKGKTVRVSFPLRYQPVKTERQKAIEYFNLDNQLPTLLVFGGSQGGKGLNRLMLDLAPQLKGIQVLHFTGQKGVLEETMSAYKKVGLKACVKEFEKRMDLAWNIADMALARAGASTIAELIAWEVPGVLIPFPHATDGHQEVNAKHFVEVVRGGELFLEQNLELTPIQKTIENLLQGGLSQKKEEIKKYKAANKFQELHELIAEYG